MSNTASSHDGESRRSEDSIFEREPQRCTMMNCEELLKPARSYTKVEVRPKVWIRTYVWRSNCPKHGLLDEETGKMACPSGAPSDANIKKISVPSHARKRSVPSLIAHASKLYAMPSVPPPSLPLPSLPAAKMVAHPGGPATPYPASVAPLPLPLPPYASSAFMPAPSTLMPAASVVHPFAAAASVMAPRIPPSALPPVKSLPSPPRPPRPTGADGRAFTMPKSHLMI